MHVHVTVTYVISRSRSAGMPYAMYDNSEHIQSTMEKPAKQWWAQMRINGVLGGSARCREMKGWK